MTPDELRRNLIDRLKHCAEAAEVRVLFAEVYLMFARSQVDESVEKSFWDGVLQDLDVLRQEATTCFDTDVASMLTAVLAAAQEELIAGGKLNPKGPLKASS